MRVTGLQGREAGGYVHRSKIDNRKQIRPPAGIAVPNEGLPDHFLTRPAGLLAFRLRETPLPAPPPTPLPPIPDRPALLPFQTCDGCERAFRAPEPGRCRDCRNHPTLERLRAAG